jgi:predicted DNA-binding protein
MREARCKMAITLQFSPEVETRLQERARRSGVDVTTYIYQIVEKDLHERRTFDEALTDTERQRWLEETFEAIDRKYGEAMRNLAQV